MNKRDRARKNVQDQRDWMRDHGMTLFGYMEHYWDSYPEEIAEMEIKKIYQADLNAMIGYQNELTVLGGF